MANGITWDTLPHVVRELAEEQVGAVAHAVPAHAGNHASLAVTLHHADGSRSFAKGAPSDNIEGRLIRYEAQVLPAVAPFAPRLLGAIEAGGWTVILLEHIDGRHADYTPGSPDLPLVAKTIAELQHMPCPEPVRMQIKDRWSKLGDSAPMDGHALLHTDINPANVLLTGDRLVLVDWAFTSKGARWLELAQLAPWLIRDGHAPAEANAWLSQFPSWAAADPTHINLHAWFLVERWSQHTARHTDRWIAEHAALAEQWHAYRAR